jgi:phenylacetic acid degradation operon negative regulatory protein
MIWTTDLLYLLDLLGVSERATRSTLSRMVRKGWLVSRKQGRRSQYSLTARGQRLLEEGKRRVHETPCTDWDGLWYSVIYSIPESKRNLRHVLRQNLIWLGFGRLAPATWVSPHNRQAELESISNELGVQEHVDLFSSKYLGLSSVQELIQRCWNLPELETEYQKFVTRYQAEHEMCQAQSEEQLRSSSDACFVRRFWVTQDFQSFPRKDPNLPTVLLPPDWIGFTARQLFEDYLRLLDTYSNEFVDAVVKGEIGK